ncbi:MAG: NADH-quinone oxidoreductase subunit D [Nitrospinota bacterium]|nr:NADH-quinone oxidoreductase subunit D [Nitrospinota bacterium]
MSVENDARMDLHAKEMILNMGPSHPATHGTVRFLLKLDGEKIVHMETEIGYLHRGFEKHCENGTWTQAFPYTDRLNYNSAMQNNVAYALAVEKLMGVSDKLPERAQYIRVMVCELARLADHYTNLGAAALELGALTAFIYLVESRELVWDLIESVCGARLTSNYIRIGGLSADLPEGFKEHVKEVFDKTKVLCDEFDRLLTHNRIFVDRMRDVAPISKEDAIAFGFTGPCLRAAGVEYDVRKANPYLVYDKLDFDVPVGTTGDNFDIYLVRLEEINQSIRIVEQVLEKMPEGPINIDDPAVRQPSKEDVSSKMESMIFHFKNQIEGIKVPKGEAYFATEGSNGEVGFYVVSDGSGKPFKCRVRPPCIPLTQAMGFRVQGAFLADIIPTFDMINLIGGECDR